MLLRKHDTIYSEPLEKTEPFSFDSSVAEVFDDMIHRSVPLYEETQRASVFIAKEFVQPNSIVYDLGCSTGTTLALLVQKFADSKIQIYGIDNSESMLKKCRENLTVLGYQNSVKLINTDLTTFVPLTCSVIIMNYTLQFIHPNKRIEILSRLANSLLPNGVLIFSEKVIHQNQTLQQTTTELHHIFKRQNNYSDLEISQKRDALENVLIPWTLEENISAAKKAGFQTVEVFLRWYNFASLIAIK